MSGLRLFSLLALAAGCLVAVSAQNPVKTIQKAQATVSGAQAAASAGSAAAAPAGSPAAAPEDNLLMEGESLYRHQADRDPFTPLVRGAVGRGSDVKVRPGATGLSRFTVESCILEAILKTAQGTVAWFQGPDNKPYKATVGEHFADGVVLDVSFGAGEVTVQQELNDPTAIKPFRNLVLRIRSQEGEGQ
jgi:Tfp pilus assembly protein PilP